MHLLCVYIPVHVRLVFWVDFHTMHGTRRTKTAFTFVSKCKLVPSNIGARGGVVIKALCYKPAGRGFDSRWCHWNFSVTYSYRSHYGPGVDSASNRNEYQVFVLGVKAAGV